jgi:hypothetical protein
MNPFVIFAINVGDFIQVIVVLLIIIVSVIGKLVAGMREIKKPGVPPVARPQQPMPQIPQMRPMPQQQPQVQVPRPKSVKDEIEEFLRRAAEKKQPSSASPLPRTPRSNAPVVQQAEIVQAEIASDRPVGGEVTEHVKKYLDETQFTQRASKFGGDVAAADKKREDHLKQVFGHGISKLASKPGETSAPPTPPSTGFFQDEVPVLAAAGTGIASLLNNIDNLRQAIVINEILQRPVDRWK